MLVVTAVNAPVPASGRASPPARGRRGPAIEPRHRAPTRVVPASCCPIVVADRAASRRLAGADCTAGRPNLGVAWAAGYPPIRLAGASSVPLPQVGSGRCRRAVRLRRRPADQVAAPAPTPRGRLWLVRVGMELIGEGLGEALRLLVTADAELLSVIALSLIVSLSATGLAALVGIPVGAILSIRRFRGRRLVDVLVNTGMGLPPVVVGLVVTIVLWRTGPLGALRLLYTPEAMVLAQFLVATPIVAGICRGALDLLDPEVRQALRADGASDVVVGRELVLAAWPQVVLAVAAGFGRAIAEVGASLMVGGNLAGQTRILTTAITLETSRGDFARALALGAVLLVLAFAVNGGLAWRGRAQS